MTSPWAGVSTTPQHFPVGKWWKKKKFSGWLIVKGQSPGKNSRVGSATFSAICNGIHHNWHFRLMGPDRPYDLYCEYYANTFHQWNISVWRLMCVGVHLLLAGGGRNVGEFKLFSSRTNIRSPLGSGPALELMSTRQPNHKLLQKYCNLKSFYSRSVKYIMHCYVFCPRFLEQDIDQ